MTSIHGRTPLLSALSLAIALCPGAHPQNAAPPAANAPAALKPPATMHFCAAGCTTGKGATLYWENGRYFVRPGSDVVFTIERFTRESVILHRTDSGRYPGRAVLTGQISSDGNSILNGKITWTYHPCCGLSSGGYRLAWGSAIDTVPGSDVPVQNAASTPAPATQARAATEPAIRPNAAPPTLRSDPASNHPAPPARQPEPAAPEPPPSLKPGVLPAFDLNGIWQRPTGNPQQPVQRILVTVIGGAIEGINIDRVAYLLPGTEFLRGTAASPDSFKVLALGVVDTPGITNSKVVQSPETLKVIDADHFQFVGKVTFSRTSRGAAANVPCDARNPSHISGNEALARGMLIDYYGKDARAAVCWYRVGAEQGNAQAQLNYGTALMRGMGGLAPDPAQGFAWLQKSAMQGNDLAASNLSREFSSGQLVPRSEQRSKYWQTRAQLNDVRWFHQQEFLPIPSWAADTAGPCDPAHPPQVSTNPGDGARPPYKADGQPRAWRGSAEAFAQGRVAYEARALETAACWFQVAAASPVLEVLPTVADVSRRANVYLGILHVFGLGVRKDPVRGFELMKKAADAGDGFGMMYLANFYRYGIGTRPDMNQASALVDRVMRSSEGIDTFMRVQGTLLTGAEAFQTALSGLSAISQGTTCKSEIGAGGVTYLKDCVDHAEEWIAGHLGGRPARHTIDHPEEIWPEHFDAEVPPEIEIEKASGMPVDRHGRKIQ